MEDGGTCTGNTRHARDIIGMDLHHFSLHAHALVSEIVVDLLHFKVAGSSKHVLFRIRRVLSSRNRKHTRDQASAHRPLPITES